ncbi:MAG: PrsW family glutamic-type intramembrane protease, partial [Bryobacteraceae bacterium]
MGTRPGGPYQPRSSDAPTKSQLFPFLGKGKEVVNKAHFIPFVVLFLMGFLLPHPFLWFMAFGLGIATYYLVYRMCGKPIAPWVPLVPAAFTVALLYFGLDIFDKIFSIPMTIALPDNPAQWAFIPYPTLFYNLFVQVGLKEELIKAVVVLICAFLIPQIAAPFARQLEVREPLDGILIATGSALGFTMLETMGQYVP